MARGGSRYTRDFGTVPRFRAGLHGGMVTAGELGDLRRQIVFVGDILNTAARLEEYAKRTGLDLVVSGLAAAAARAPPGGGGPAVRRARAARQGGAGGRLQPVRAAGPGLRFRPRPD